MKQRFLSESCVARVISPYSFPAAIVAWTWNLRKTSQLSGETFPLRVMDCLIESDRKGRRPRPGASAAKMTSRRIRVQDHKRRCRPQKHPTLNRNQLHLRRLVGQLPRSCRTQPCSKLAAIFKSEVLNVIADLRKRVLNPKVPVPRPAPSRPSERECLADCRIHVTNPFAIALSFLSAST